MLFNNADVLLDAVYQSPQNNEMYFEVNMLSPYPLTTLLKPALDSAEARVIINTITDGLNRQTLPIAGQTSVLPALLRPLRAFMFAPPHKGAGLLHDAAFETHQTYASGSYIQKGRAYPLKFKLSADEKNRLLKHIDAGEPA